MTGVRVRVGNTSSTELPQEDSDIFLHKGGKESENLGVKSVMKAEDGHKAIDKVFLGLVGY